MNSKALKKRKKKKIKSRQKQQELRKQNKKKTQQAALLGQRDQAELQPVNQQNPPRKKRKLPPQRQLPIPVNTHSKDEKETTTGHKSESDIEEDEKGIVAEKSKDGEELVNREKEENNEEEDEDEEVEEEEEEDVAPPEGFFSPHIADPASLLEDEEEEDEAKEKTEMESKKPSDKGISFSLDNTVLIVGDGNFSFSLALAQLLKEGRNMVCTCLDSATVLVEKYPEVPTIIEKLKQMDAKVLYEVDATKLATDRRFKGKVFDRIVFNFPHAGKGIKDQDRNIQSNQVLLKEFMENGLAKLSRTGQIHITLKTGMPYDKWGVVGIAKRADLLLSGSSDFRVEDYPGYSHRRTAGFKPGVSGEANEDITYKKCKTFYFVRKEYHRLKMKEKEKEKQAKLKKRKKRKRPKQQQKNRGGGQTTTNHHPAAKKARMR